MRRIGNEEEDSALNSGLRDEEFEFSKKPIAVVNPVASVREKTEIVEVSVHGNKFDIHSLVRIRKEPS